MLLPKDEICPWASLPVYLINAIGLHLFRGEKESAMSGFDTALL